MAAKKRIWILVLSVLAAALLDAYLVYEWTSEEGFSTDSVVLVLFLAGACLLLALAVIALVLHNSAARSALRPLLPA